MIDRTLVMKLTNAVKEYCQQHNDFLHTEAFDKMAGDLHLNHKRAPRLGSKNRDHYVVRRNTLRREVNAQLADDGLHIQRVMSKTKGAQSIYKLVDRAKSGLLRMKGHPAIYARHQMQYLKWVEKSLDERSELAPNFPPIQKELMLNHAQASLEDQQRALQRDFNFMIALASIGTLPPELTTS